jgi:BASS family bile acid:Na+ symporter
MSKILEVALSLSALVFVFSSMLAIGLSLTIARIIGPLHNARLVVPALVADFGPAPVPAYLTVKAHRPSRFRG